MSEVKQPNERLFAASPEANFKVALAMQRPVLLPVLFPASMAEACNGTTIP